MFITLLFYRKLFGADGGTRTPTAIRPTDFHTTSVFTATNQCLWSGLSLRLSQQPQALPVQSLHLPIKGLARDWHQPSWKLSPNLSSSTPTVSSGALNLFKSVASTNSATSAQSAKGHRNREDVNGYTFTRCGARRTLIAAVSKLVLMCVAQNFSIISTLVRQFLAIW